MPCHGAGHQTGGAAPNGPPQAAQGARPVPGMPLLVMLVNLTADCRASQVWLSGMTGVTAGPARTLKSIGIMLILSPEIDSTPQNYPPNPSLGLALGDTMILSLLFTT